MRKMRVSQVSGDEPRDGAADEGGDGDGDGWL
jgi:hypothetical protein